MVEHKGIFSSNCSHKVGSSKSRKMSLNYVASLETPELIWRGVHFGHDVCVCVYTVTPRDFHPVLLTLTQQGPSYSSYTR